MDPWKYEGKEIYDVGDMPDGTHGFVYIIEHKPTGMKYIGKKALYHYRKSKYTKTELKELDYKGRPPKWKRDENGKIIKEPKSSNWERYFSSAKDLKRFMKDHDATKDEFERKIIKYCSSKRELTYEEARQQMIEDVVRRDDYLNKNILGSFFQSELYENK